MLKAKINGGIFSLSAETPPKIAKEAKY